MFKNDNGIVNLEIAPDDWTQLTFVLGYAAGVAYNDPDKTRFWRIISLSNRLNQGNPHFHPYEIPAEYADPT